MHCVRFIINSLWLLNPNRNTNCSSCHYSVQVAVHTHSFIHSAWFNAHHQTDCRLFNLQSQFKCLSSLFHQIYGSFAYWKYLYTTVVLFSCWHFNVDIIKILFFWVLLCFLFAFLLTFAINIRMQRLDSSKIMYIQTLCYDKCQKNERINQTNEDYDTYIPELSKNWQFTANQICNM